MNHPDGMATMATERAHVERMNNIDEPTHDIVAVDEDGDIMYETACAWGEADADYEVQQHMKRHERGDDYGEGPVSHFKAVKR